MKKIISVDDLSETEIADLCVRAARGEAPTPAPNARHAVGLIFMEPSTRTRTSFERAAHKLGLRTVLIDAKGTSIDKGESLEDTLLNLQALDVNPFVVRTPHTGSLDKVRELEGVALVNGGDGVGEHPSQALLDLTTLLQLRDFEPRRLRGLKLGILGDLKRSRVARSWSRLAPRFGIELTFISPASWRADWIEGFRWTDRKAEALPELDVLMCLRVQKERMESGALAEGISFARDFHVHPRELSERQRLFHPGPVNWGIELSAEFRTDDPRSLVLEQVRNGLAVRSLILEFLRKSL